jgi:hypothetical protein
MTVSFQVSFQSDKSQTVSFPMCRFESGVASSTYATGKRQSKATQATPPTETTNVALSRRATMCRFGFPLSSQSPKIIVPRLARDAVNEIATDAASVRGVCFRSAMPQTSHGDNSRKNIVRDGVAKAVVSPAHLGSHDAVARCLLQARIGLRERLQWAAPLARHRHAFGPGAAALRSPRRHGVGL